MKGAHSCPSGLGNDGCVGSTFFPPSPSDSCFSLHRTCRSSATIHAIVAGCLLEGCHRKESPKRRGCWSCGCARVYLGSSLATSQHNSTASCRSWKRPWYGLETLPIHSDIVPVTEVALSRESLLANYSVSLVCSINGNWNKNTRFLDL